jgi:hypothetical protein
MKSAKNDRIRGGKAICLLNLPHIAREVKGFLNKIPSLRASWFPEGRWFLVLVREQRTVSPIVIDHNGIRSFVLKIPGWLSHADFHC